MMQPHKPRVAVHKFASCDGCQLAFLNLGPELLRLARLVDIIHFIEAGPVFPDARVDIAFVEGSISTAEDIERIQRIRRNSRWLVTIGACATAGGIQALRNSADVEEWKQQVYARPETIAMLAESTPVAAHVKVDVELWGCPVNGEQVLATLRSLLFGVPPVSQGDSVCMECKRKSTVCVMVSSGVPCMGPVTRGGCGALCPQAGRGCYACFGPADVVNGASLGQRFVELGLTPRQAAERFLFINNAAPAFAAAGQHWQRIDSADLTAARGECP